jgi:hypothetical protein
MGRIVFHVGWPKTGSTSIQQYMTTHRDALKEAGFYWPRNFVNPGDLGDPRSQTVRGEMKGASHSVILKELTPAPIGKRGQKVAGEMLSGAFDNALDVFERSGCHTMVLSNENTFWRSRDIARDHIPTRLSEHAVEFVVYFRRYDQYYPSLFKQRVKAKDLRQNFAAFLERRLAAPRPLQHIRTLTDLFGGRVIVRSYDAASRAIIPDFLRTLGVPDSFHADNKDAVSTQRNPSFSDLLTLFVLDFQRRGVPADLAEETWERLRKLNKHGRLPADLPKLTLASEATRRELLDHYNADLRDLRAAGLAALPEVDPGTIATADEPGRDQLTDSDWNAVAEALPGPLRRRLRVKLSPAARREAQRRRSSSLAEQQASGTRPNANLRGQQAAGGAGPSDREGETARGDPDRAS